MIKFKFQSNILRKVENLVSSVPVLNANLIWIGVSTLVCPDELADDFRELLVGEDISLAGVGEADFDETR